MLATIVSFPHRCDILDLGGVENVLTVGKTVLSGRRRPVRKKQKAEGSKRQAQAIGSPLWSDMVSVIALVQHPALVEYPIAAAAAG
jgi:hypothetical protein